MPAVFVHGVPETAVVWDALRANLHRDDVIALQLPGFGCPRPAGFGATKEDYVAWLIGELERIAAQGPIDLVGHDWGGGFVLRTVSTRADLVRSWLTDIAALAHPDFEWHAIAQVWQTPDAGEEFFVQSLAQPAEERAQGYNALFGVPLDAAIEMNRNIDETMGECILELYRSAVNVGKEWGPDFHDIPKPGCILLATADTLTSHDVARRAAAGAGAQVRELADLNHFWMLQDPIASAAAIEEYWAMLP